MNPIEMAKELDREGNLDEDTLRTVLGLVEDAEAFLAELDKLGIKVKKAPHRRRKGLDDAGEDEEG